MIRKFLLVPVLLAVNLISDCGKSAFATDGGEKQHFIEQQLAEMSLHEKVCLMFFVRPEALAEEDSVQNMTPSLKAGYEKYPVGGFTLFGKNISSPVQLEEFTSALKTLEDAPLLSVDEEGGRVARVADTKAFHLRKTPSMEEIAKSENPDSAYNAARYIGTYLRQYGFDIDFAPVADVNTNPENTVIGARAFGSDPAKASVMAVGYLKGLWSAEVKGCLKHFPGHGDTKGDTHTGYAASSKTWEGMDSCELVTFKAGIKAGVKMIMAAHIAAPKVTGSDIPSTISKVILTDKLRGELGYEGIIITDAMEMGAISQNYTCEESTVGAIKAGCDIILMPKDVPTACKALEDAVDSGEISEERINESVRRILSLKYDCNEQ